MQNWCLRIDVHEACWPKGQEKEVEIQNWEELWEESIQIIPTELEFSDQTMFKQNGWSLFSLIEIYQHHCYTSGGIRMRLIQNWLLPLDFPNERKSSRHPDFIDTQKYSMKWSGTNVLVQLCVLEATATCAHVNGTPSGAAESGWGSSGKLFRTWTLHFSGLWSHRLRLKAGSVLGGRIDRLLWWLQTLNISAGRLCIFISQYPPCSHSL